MERRLQDQIVNLEGENNTLPTSLDLPGRLYGKKLDSVGRLAKDILGIKSAVKRAHEAITNFGDVNAKRIVRLTERRNDLIEQIRDIDSSRVVGVFYLKLQQELSEMGVSPEDIFNLFKECLKISTEFHGFDNYNLSTKSDSKERVSAIRNFYKNAIMRVDKPAWYKGSNEGWQNLVYERSLFAIYLNPPEAISGGMLQLHYRYPFNCCTDKENYPDWMNGLESSSTPDLSVVKSELTEDEDELKRIIEDRKKTSHHMGFIKDNYLKRAHGFSSWLRSQFNPLLSESVGVGKLIYLLDLLPVVHDLDNPEYQDIIDNKMGKLSHFKREYYKDPILGTIRHYFSGTINSLSEESVALWLEDALVESGLVGNVKNLIDDNLIDCFELMVNQSEGPKSLRWLAVKDQSPKAYRNLCYGLRILLNNCPKQDLVELVEILRHFKGESVEHIIWEIAQMIEKDIERITSIGNENPQLNQVMNQIQKFAVQWTSNHHQWLLEQYNKKLNGKVTSLEPVNIQQSQDRLKIISLEPEVKPSLEQEIEKKVDEIKQEERELQKIELDKWRVFYNPDAKNSNQRPESWEEILGNDDVSRERNLAAYIGRSKIPCSIKVGSIIGVLEDIVNTPEEVEYTQIGQRINGEKVNKRKRANMRVFYWLDREQRRLVFSLYLKEDMSYRKL